MDDLKFRSLSIADFPNTVRGCVRHNVPLFVKGAPGVGKTEIPQQVVAELDGLCSVVVLGGRDIGDFMMPFVSDGALKFYYNDALPVEGSRWDTPQNRERLIVLLLDEMSNAKPLMQNFALKIFDERLIGERKLLPNVRLIATGNRDWDLGHTEQISAALANRASFINVEPDLNAWVARAIHINVNPVTVAWVKFSPDHLLFVDEKQFLAGDPATCSPRSNVRLGKLQDAYDAGDLNENSFMSLVDGTIGNSIGPKYLGFIKFREQMPDLGKLLSSEDEARIAKKPSIPEVLYTVIFSIVQRADRKNLKAAVTYIERLAPEWQSMFSNALSTGKPELVATAAWGAFAAKVANL